MESVNRGQANARATASRNPQEKVISLIFFEDIWCFRQVTLQRDLVFPERDIQGPVRSFNCPVSSYRLSKEKGIRVNTTKEITTSSGGGIADSSS